MSTSNRTSAIDNKKVKRAGLTALFTFLVLVVAGIAAVLGIDFDAAGILEDTGSDVILSDPPFPETSGGRSADWYAVYFTDPTCPAEAAARVGGIDEVLATDLLRAASTVDVAAFEIDSETITNALISLEKRGVVVRVVTDEDFGDERSIRRLRRNGISVVEDKRSALMHNKFVIIDGRILWTGSMNLTDNGAYCNNNNYVRFDSPALAANYTAEMDEMYSEREFGPRSPLNVVNREVVVDGVRIENYLGPEDDIAPVIAARIAAAESQVLFMAFSFTNDTIGSALDEQVRAGLEVRGVYEAAGSETTYSYFSKLLAASAGLMNFGVRQDGNPRIMHHKVFIIDGAVTIFGSYNFSNNANDSNDENVLIVHDPLFARYFSEEFERIWAEALP